MGNYFYYRLQEVTLIRNCYSKWIVNLKQHYRLMITHLKNRKKIKWRLQQCALDYLQTLIIFADTRAKEYISCWDEWEPCWVTSFNPFHQSILMKQCARAFIKFWNHILSYYKTHYIHFWKALILWKTSYLISWYNGWN